MAAGLARFVKTLQQVKRTGVDPHHRRRVVLGDPVGGAAATDKDVDRRFAQRVNHPSRLIHRRFVKLDLDAELRRFLTTQLGQVPIGRDKYNPAHRSPVTRIF